MNKINPELELKRLARQFAERQQIKIEVFFSRPPGDKFNDEWYRHRGFCDRVSKGSYRIYIKLDRTRSLVFRTLAHELAHAGQQEKGNKKHNLAFWQTLDDYTLPFVLDNLVGEDRESLLNLSNPTINQVEERDGVYLEAEEGIITISVEPGDINEKWKMIRQETIQGNLGGKTLVSTKRTSQSKHGLTIYVVEKEIDQVVEKLRELGFSEEDMKIKRPGTAI